MTKLYFDAVALLLISTITYHILAPLNFSSSGKKKKSFCEEVQWKQMHWFCTKHFMYHQVNTLKPYCLSKYGMGHLEYNAVHSLIIAFNKT